MQDKDLLEFSSKKKFSLNGDWEFRQQKHNSWLPASVPGCNFTDLIACGQINDPFYSDHENKVQWIESQNWEYQKEFYLEQNWLDLSDIELIFEGLDTYSEVFLNGFLLLNSRNMFVGHRLSCKQHLLAGKNHLLVVFRSPIQEVYPLFESNGFTYPAENDKSQEKLSVFCRKAPYHFGWDWGPRLVTSGIWRHVYLSAINRASIEDICFKQQSLSDEQACLEFVVAIKNFENFNGLLKLNCENVAGLEYQVNIDVQDKHQIVSLKLSIKQPKRWWPNGLGEAFLYRFNIELHDQNQLLDTGAISIGLRTIEVVNQADQMGESFYLKVNGQPTFMKGANYIPPDSFTSRVSKDKYRQIFIDAVSANMNMLRVWGGGIYEDDEFYRLADENGILIWQDFMFACTLYPADPAFIENVTEEAVYNIKRLRNHACLALWCGNNETEMGIQFWQWQKKFNYSDERFEQLKQDYRLLFKNVLAELVNSYDPSRFYFSSSPIGYWENESDDSRGNGHYWGVWHGGEPFTEFKKRIPRFMSEYGFQSFPILQSVKQYAAPADWHIDSSVMKVHQKHPRGNQLIKQYMQGEFQPCKDFESFLYLSQVQQALGMKLAFEAHRMAMPYCMGSLYWQFNDCWPVASWSSIDYYGRWKALHYQAKRSFEPIAVFIDTDNSELTIKAVSDVLSATQVIIEQRVMTFDGVIVWSNKQNLTLEPLSSVSIASHNIDTLLEDCCAEQVVMSVTLFEDCKDKPTILSEALHYFVPTKSQALTIPRFKLDTSVESGCLTVRISTNVLARQVYLSIESVLSNFSDNFFDLLPGQEKQICLLLSDENQTDWPGLIEKLGIVSIIDTYK